MVELGLITDCANRPEHDLQIAAMGKQTRFGLSFAVGAGELRYQSPSCFISETREALISAFLPIPMTAKWQVRHRASRQA
jgi:hypothetical protein